MFKKIKNLFIKYKEIISYLFWGGMTTLVSWGSYSLFVYLLPESGYRVALANTLSWIAAVLFAFVTNKMWVFGSKSWEPSLVVRELWKFVASRLVTGVIENVGVPLLVKIGLNQKLFGIDGLPAKIIISVVVVILNYIFSKLLVFKNKKETTVEPLNQNSNGEDDENVGNQN